MCNMEAIIFEKCFSKGKKNAMANCLDGKMLAHQAPQPQATGSDSMGPFQGA